MSIDYLQENLYNGVGYQFVIEIDNIWKDGYTDELFLHKDLKQDFIYFGNKFNFKI